MGIFPYDRQVPLHSYMWTLRMRAPCTAEAATGETAHLPFGAQSPGLLAGPHRPTSSAKQRAEQFYVQEPHYHRRR